MRCLFVVFFAPHQCLSTSKKSSNRDTNMLSLRKMLLLILRIRFGCVRTVGNGAQSNIYSLLFIVKSNLSNTSLFYSVDAVKCDSCKSYFHMGCVQPPLVSKPSRGYGWTCAPCSRRREDRVDNGEARTPTPPIPKVVKPVTAPTRGRGRPRKDKSLNPKVDDDIQVKHYKLWPFRYFGCV